MGVSIVHRYKFVDFLSYLLLITVVTGYHQLLPPPSKSFSKRTTTRLFQSSSPPETTLEEWTVLPNGRVEGKVSNHPEIENGCVISTAPLVDPQSATEFETVETKTGSQYLLLGPPSPLEENEEEEEEEDETKSLLKKVKDAGIAGVISYALWEFGFWTISVPVCIVAYRQVTGHWPDFSDSQDLQQLGAEAFAFVNLARFAVPLRIGLALGTTPFIQKNIVDRFMTKKEEI